MKTCKDCGCIRTPENSTRGNIPCRRCNACEIKRRNAKKPGKVARKLIKDLKKDQKKRPKTDRQLRKIEEEKIYQAARNVVMGKQHEEHGFYFCLNCGYSTMKREEIETHHLLKRSLEHRIDIKHSTQNLYPLCHKCHKIIGNNKEMNDELIRERGLDKVFKKDQEKLYNSKEKE